MGLFWGSCWGCFWGRFWHRFSTSFRLLLGCCWVASWLLFLLFGCCSVAACVLLGCCSGVAWLLFGCCLGSAWLLLGCCSDAARLLLGCCGPLACPTKSDHFFSLSLFSVKAVPHLVCSAPAVVHLLRASRSYVNPGTRGRSPRRGVARGSIGAWSAADDVKRSFGAKRFILEKVQIIFELELHQKLLVKL